jgi:hypothetical protein
MDKIGQTQNDFTNSPKKDLDKKTHSTVITAATVSVAEQQIPKN